MPYPRELAAFPVAGLRVTKYFPPVGRIDAAYGDRNLVCSCPPIEEFATTGYASGLQPSAAWSRH